VSAAAALVLAAACTASAPPPADPNAFVRALVGAQRQREEALSRYTYDVAEVREELDREGRARRRESREYEVYHVRGRAVRRLVRRDGRDLEGREREKEDARARELASALGSGRAATEQPGLRLSRVLERYDFAFAGREEREGRCAVVFSFTARPGDFPLERDGVLRRLAGRLWVDQDERAVARVEVHNTEGLRFALGLGATVSSLGFAADFVRMEDGVWLPRRVQASAIGRKLLVRRFRTRSTTTFSAYRRFGVEVEEAAAP
jgi:hypothetical protein